jgi:hypothetical protein
MRSDWHIFALLINIQKMDGHRFDALLSMYVHAGADKLVGRGNENLGSFFSIPRILWKNRTYICIYLFAALRSVCTIRHVVHMTRQFYVCVLYYFIMFIIPALFCSIIFLPPIFCLHIKLFEIFFFTWIGSAPPLQSGSAFLFGINAVVSHCVGLVLIWLINCQGWIKVIKLLPWPLFPHVAQHLVLYDTIFPFICRIV